METTVELEGPLRFPMWMPVMGAAALLAGIVVLSVWLWLRLRTRKGTTSRPNQVAVISKAKKVYLRRLNTLERRVRKGNLPLRDAYGELSSLVREFATEVDSATDAATGGRNFTVMTLDDLSHVGLEGLTQVIARCYVPEFAERSDSDVLSDIEFAKEMMSGWNYAGH